MANPETEDPELDFTDFMEKQKAQLSATAPADTDASKEERAPTSPTLIRGIIFFGILLLLLGVLIVLYMNRPAVGGGKPPEGYRLIEVPGSPPKLQKNQ